MLRCRHVLILKTHTCVHVCVCVCVFSGAVESLAALELVEQCVSGQKLTQGVIPAEDSCPQVAAYAFPIVVHVWGSGQGASDVGAARVLAVVLLETKEVQYNQVEQRMVAVEKIIAKSCYVLQDLFMYRAMQRELFDVHRV